MYGRAICSTPKMAEGETLFSELALSHRISGMLAANSEPPVGVGFALCLLRDSPLLYVDLSADQWPCWSQRGEENLSLAPMTKSM